MSIIENPPTVWFDAFHGGFKITMLRDSFFIQDGKMDDFVEKAKPRKGVKDVIVEEDAPTHITWKITLEEGYYERPIQTAGPVGLVFASSSHPTCYAKHYRVNNKTVTPKAWFEALCGM